jgi:hypothetical protein
MSSASTAPLNATWPNEFRKTEAKSKSYVRSRLEARRAHHAAQYRPIRHLGWVCRMKTKEALRDSMLAVLHDMRGGRL